MRLQLKKVSEQIIVITGATSGIGLATARAAAARGAKLVVASRNEDELRILVEEIRHAGGQAELVVADVADPEAVMRIAMRAIDVFGAFDTWVNNAGVSIYGRLQDVPLEEKRRLFDVNFWGVVHGCRAAVPHLKVRGGAIINVGSVLSERAIPLQGIYVASKHAVKGYTDSLRMELEMENAPISVTLIKPAAIDTPYVQHARNHLDVEPKNPPPVYAPDIVADAVLEAAEVPQRDVLVGGASKMFSLVEKTMPRVADLMMEHTMWKMQRTNRPPTPGDSLFAPPNVEGEERGTYEGHVVKSSLYNALTKRSRGSALVGVGLLALIAIRIATRA
ncbi:MAG: short-chain dehydrogenase [Myxococcaceae bacterium]|nr:short-chain dehydrogenase [Myxococcaceae bacterium]